MGNHRILIGIVSFLFTMSFILSSAWATPQVSRCNSQYGELTKKLAEANSPPAANFFGQCNAACQMLRHYREFACTSPVSLAQATAEFTAVCGDPSRCPEGDEECPDPTDPRTALTGLLGQDCDHAAATGAVNSANTYLQTVLCLDGWDPADNLPTTIQLSFLADNPTLNINYNRTATLSIFTAAVTNLEIGLDINGNFNGLLTAHYTSNGQNLTVTMDITDDTGGFPEFEAAGIIATDLDQQLLTALNTLLGVNLAMNDPDFADSLLSALGFDPLTAMSAHALASTLLGNVGQALSMIPQLAYVFNSGFFIDSNNQVVDIDDFLGLLATAFNNTCTPVDDHGVDTCVEDGQPGICLDNDPNNPPALGDPCEDSCSCEI